MSLSHFALSSLTQWISLLLSLPCVLLFTYTHMHAHRNWIHSQIGTLLNCWKNE
jgi:hypothetical protein